MTINEFKLKRLEKLKDSHYEGVVNTQYETLMIRAMLGLGVDLYIDIGANEGELIDIVTSAKSGIDTIAYEPDIRSYKILEEKYGSNKKIKLYNEAIYKRNGVKKMYYKKNDSSQSSLKYNSEKTYRWVICKKLDSIISKLKNYNTILIKIDTEGTEPEVIEGMKKIINSDKSLIIIMEYSYKWMMGIKEIAGVFLKLHRDNFIVMRFSPFGLELLNDTAAYHLRNYHYSSILLTKNVNIVNSYEMMPSETGLLNFIKLSDEIKYDFTKAKGLL